MSILKFNVGRSGASGSHTNYITRENACDSISFHNLDELETDSDYEKRVNASSYTHNREEEELSKNPNGRTHYRVVLSWEGKEDTETAKEQSHKFLNDNFEKGRGIVAIHQDTENTHAHVWLDSRQTDEKKIQLDAKTYRQLDERWAKQYDKTYQTNRAEEYREKKQETQDYKKAKGKGLDAEKPDRAKMTSEKWREKDEKDAGLKNYGIEEKGVGRNQQFTSERKQLVEKSEQGIARATRQINRTESEARGIHQRVERMAGRERNEEINK